MDFQICPAFQFHQIFLTNFNFIQFFNSTIFYRVINFQIFNLVLQWVPEISHHCQKTPFLLVGTQIDLREDVATIDKLAKNKQKPLSNEAGEKLAKELRAVKYVECSALTQVSHFNSMMNRHRENITLCPKHEIYFLSAWKIEELFR